MKLTDVFYFIFLLYKNSETTRLFLIVIIQCPTFLKSIKISIYFEMCEENLITSFDNDSRDPFSLRKKITPVKLSDDKPIISSRKVRFFTKSKFCYLIYPREKIHERLLVVFCFTFKGASRVQVT